jgi:hypothetical protein
VISHVLNVLVLPITVTHVEETEKTYQFVNVLLDSMKLSKLTVLHVIINALLVLIKTTNVQLVLLIELELQPAHVLMDFSMLKVKPTVQFVTNIV